MRSRLLGGLAAAAACGALATAEIPAGAQTIPPLQAGVHVYVLSLLKNTVVYSVTCNLACVGDTYYQVYATINGTTVREGRFDYGPVNFLIKNPTGGSATVIRRYTRRQLRPFARLLRRGAVVNVIFYAKATDAFGRVVRAQTLGRLTD